MDIVMVVDTMEVVIAVVDISNEQFETYLPAAREAPAGYLNYTNAGGEKVCGGFEVQLLIELYYET
jgi:hypothetical protein